MLKSCKYCMRIHDSKHDCGHKPKHKKRYTNANSFRNTQAWQCKRTQIKERDKYICQVCIRKLYNTINQYNHECLEVHHAIPIDIDYDKCLDDNNLITVCERHHEMAECGDIPLDIVLAIIREQEGVQRF